jgi:nitroreductase
MAEASEPRSQTLESIIRERRSCRRFAADVPPPNLIERILDAGMHAPYAALAYAGRDDFRRFFVFAAGSREMAEVRAVVDRHVKRMADELSERIKQDPDVAARLEPFRERLSQARLPDAPWLVVVAEPTGFPPATPQSLAHCLQNMWLMATALGLNMQLLSVFESMGADERLNHLLGLKPGEWGFNGCALGYTAATLPASPRPDARSLTTWFR